MAYISISSKEFQVFCEIILPLLKNDLNTHSVDAMLNNIQRKTNKQISDKSLENIYNYTKTRNKGFQENKLDILCAYYDFDTLNNLINIQAYKLIPSKTTQEAKYITLLSIKERLEYYQLYDFDNRILSELCYKNYENTLKLCKEASEMGLDTFQEVIDIKTSLVIIASDLFCFKKAKELRNELLPILVAKYGITHEYSIRKHKLDIYTFHDFEAHEQQYQQAQTIYAEQPVKSLYALNRLGFTYLIEGDTAKANEIFKKCEDKFDKISSFHTTNEDKLYQEAYILLYRGYYYYHTLNYSQAYEYLKRSMNNFLSCFDNTQYYVGIIAYLLWKTTQKIPSLEVESVNYLEQAKKNLLTYYPDRRFWIFEAKKSEGNGFGYYGENDNRTRIIYNEIS